jgi:hypothetical protein
MEALDSIRMEETTTTIMVEMGTSITREMATTIMATGIATIMTPPGQMAIAVATTMAETIMSPRRGILVRWNASSATRLGIIPMIAPRRKMKETSPIHSRRGMLTTSMWRKIIMSLTPSMVCFCSISFQHFLFDTGASHSFISRAFVVKNKIPTETIECFSRGRVDSKCRL